MEYELDKTIKVAFEAGRATNRIGDRIGHIERADLSVPVFLDEAGNVVLLTAASEALDRMEDGPRRRAGTSKHQDLASFIAYVLRFRQEPSVVWADQSAFRVLAVLDYHDEGPEPEDAGWCGHRALYECPRSLAWREWTALDTRELKHEAFADFIEAHLEDLTSEDGFPLPADVLQMSRDLNVYTKGQITRTVDPRSGDYNMVSKQDTEVRSTPIPRAFLAALPVFDGGVPYRVECRIRFRVADGVPLFSFTMHRRQEIERDAFAAVRKEVAEQTGLPCFAGNPEAP